MNQISLMFACSDLLERHNLCTIASKINVTPKGVYSPISKQHSILAVANLLAHNNTSQISYCGQILLQCAVVNCNFSDNLTPLGVSFILLGMIPFSHIDVAESLYFRLFNRIIEKSCTILFM